ARERELLVLEDNPYGLLRYEGEPLPTLHSLDGGHYVVYLGTFSKILSPGIRLGWAAAPGPVYEKLNLGKQASDLCSSSFSQAFLDGRGGSSMRLNFSGVDEDDIREGIRRIGKVVREQVELFGTLTGRAPSAPARAADEPGADVLPLTARRRRRA